jgi:hypothetical protein
MPIGLNRLVLIAAIAGATIGQVMAASVNYVCVGQEATGFRMNKQTHEWNTENFRTRKYVIRSPKKGPNQTQGANESVLEVSEVGNEKSIPMYCKADFNQGGYLFCSGLGENFNFNRETLRFLHYFPFGYVDPPTGSFWGDEGEATPFIEIGKCSAI